MFDISKSVETPEGVDLELKTAGLPVRMYAYLIDMLIKIAIYIGCGIVVFVLGIIFSFEAASGLYLILVFIVEWFYPVICEIFMGGATPGKKAMGIVVVYDDGTPIDWSGSLVRNLLRVIDSFPIITLNIESIPSFAIMSYGLSVVSILCTKSSKRIGDIVAGTMVIHVKKATIRGGLPNIQGESPPYPLTQDEQTAIVGFLERGRGLSENRQRELADIVHPLTNKQGEPGAGLLRKFAAWLLGG